MCNQMQGKHGSGPLTSVASADHKLINSMKDIIDRASTYNVAISVVPGNVKHVLVTRVCHTFMAMDQDIKYEKEAAELLSKVKRSKKNAFDHASMANNIRGRMDSQATRKLIAGANVNDAINHTLKTKKERAYSLQERKLRASAEVPKAMLDPPQNVPGNTASKKDEQWAREILKKHRAVAKYEDEELYKDPSDASGDELLNDGDGGEMECSYPEVRQNAHKGIDEYAMDDNDMEHLGYFWWTNKVDSNDEQSGRNATRNRKRKSGETRDCPSNKTETESKSSTKSTHSPESRKAPPPYCCMYQMNLKTYFLKCGFNVENNIQRSPPSNEPSKSYTGHRRSRRRKPRDRRIVSNDDDDVDGNVSEQYQQHDGNHPHHSPTPETNIDQHCMNRNLAGGFDACIEQIPERENEAANDQVNQLCERLALIATNEAQSILEKLLDNVDDAYECTAMTQTQQSNGAGVPRVARAFASSAQDIFKTRTLEFKSELQEIVDDVTKHTVSWPCDGDVFVTGKSKRYGPPCGQKQTNAHRCTGHESYSPECAACVMPSARGWAHHRQKSKDKKIFASDLVQLNQGDKFMMVSIVTDTNNKTLFLTRESGTKNEDDVMAALAASLTDAKYFWGNDLIERVHFDGEAGVAHKKVRLAGYVSISTTGHSPASNGRAEWAVGELRRTARRALNSFDDRATRRRWGRWCGPHL